MQKYSFVPLLILFCISTAFCQYANTYTYGEFTENVETYAFYDNVKIYEEPTLGSKVIATLPILHPMIAIEEYESSEMKDGYAQNWYEVSFEKDQKEHVGYALEGSMSVASISFFKDGDETPYWFIWNLSGYNDQDFWQSRAKIVRHGEIIATTDFTPIYTDNMPENGYTYTIESRLQDESDFAKDMALFIISFIYEACGFANGDIYLTWNGKELKYGFETIDVSDAGVFSVYTDVILPSSEGGKPDQIQTVQTQEEFDEELDDYQVLSKETTVYKWDGTKLKKAN